MSIGTSQIKKIVTIGGGSGQYALLAGLRDLDNADITAIVSMSDSGGSTGRLRSDLGILPPGDILKALLALSPNREFVRNFLLKRFNINERLSGHNAGNMLIAQISEYDSFPSAVRALAEILMIKGDVLPVTTTPVTLVAELTDGSYLFGEAAIDVPRGDQREKIKKTFLVPHHSDCIEVYPPVLEALDNADYILIGPGDLYTSLIPNFLVPCVAEYIKKAMAKIIYTSNIMTKYGETEGFALKNFIDEIEEKIGRKIDVILANNRMPEEKLIKKYKAQKSELVLNNFGEVWQEREILSKDFLTTEGGVIRHDSKKLMNALEEILKLKI